MRSREHFFPFLFCPLFSFSSSSTFAKMYEAFVILHTADVGGVCPLPPQPPNPPEAWMDRQANGLEEETFFLFLPPFHQLFFSSFKDGWLSLEWFFSSSCHSQMKPDSQPPQRRERIKRNTAGAWPLFFGRVYFMGAQFKRTSTSG